jgi:SAM-dependent methyltransferase
VLEHTRRPWQVMSEIIRALKPGGLALLSAPFNHPLHAFPDDHWRFTPQGLRLLAEPLVVEALETEGPVNFPERTVLMASKGRG